MKKLTHICPEGMKTKVLIAALLLFSFSKISKAQFVTIPDANFAAHLQTVFPSALNGNQMDTTDAAIVNATQIACVGLSISDLTGIQYFDNLNMLVCAWNPLTFIPPLPSTLTWFDCSYNMLLSTLPTLPPNLELLAYAYTSVSYVPTLPATISTLNISGTSVPALPVLPPTLGLLDVTACNQLTSIPNLPSTLYTLHVDSIPNISSLPALPAGMQFLSFSNCSFTSFPNLPPSISIVDARSNSITCLPQLPDNLTNLSVGGNLVSCLPNIPANGSFFCDIGNAICNSAQIQSVVNVSCGTSCTGAITITGTAGSALDYVFSNGYSSLNNSTGNATATNVCAGNYSVTVQPTGGGGCPAQINFDIDSSLVVGIITTNVTCFGANDGILCANPTGGTGVYSYIWSNSAITQCVNSLPAGLYTVTVADANNCTGTVIAAVSEPPPLIVSCGPDQTVCDNTPFILCPTVAGGTPPYNYMLYLNGNLVPLFFPCSTPLTGSGTYSLVVTDMNGCVSSDVFNLTINPSPTLGLQTNVNSCNGVPATLCVPQVFGGTPPFAYSWNSGNITQCFSTLVTGTYSYIVVDANGCTVTGSTTYSNSSGWTAKYLDNLTLPTCGNCDGSATAVVVNGNPVATYVWYPGSITTQTNNAICDTTNSYVVITDTTGCSDTLTFSMSCRSVWPGDANYDGTANNVDLLAIGIGYGSMGLTRANATINWQAEIGLDWTDSLASGINYKHVDCNGDGIIADDDTIAIQQNYGQTHPLRLSSPTINPNDPYLYFDIIVDTVGTNQHVDVPLYFGTAAQPADSIYGLAFTVNYDTSLVKADSIGITFSPSWIGIVGTEMITLSHNDPLNGQLHVGMTRITHTDTSGYGEVARLGIVTTDNVSGKLTNPVFDTLTFSISDVTIINKDEWLRGFNIGTDSLIIEDSTTSINEVLNAQNVEVYPNPTKNEFKVSGIKFNVGDEIILTNVLGKEMSRTFIPQQTLNIRLSTLNFPAGVYFITIKTNRGNVVRKITVLH